MECSVLMSFSDTEWILDSPKKLALLHEKSASVLDPTTLAKIGSVLDRASLDIVNRAQRTVLPVESMDLYNKVESSLRELYVLLNETCQMGGPDLPWYILVHINNACDRSLRLLEQISKTELLKLLSSDLSTPSGKVAAQFTSSDGGSQALESIAEGQVWNKPEQDLKSEEELALINELNALDDPEQLYMRSLRYFDWRPKRLCGIDYYDRETCSKAIRFLEKAAQLDHAKSLHALGEYYAIFENDPSKSLPLFKNSAALGCTDALVAIGEHYYDRRELQLCREYWKQAAEAGNGRGYHHLGRWHYEIDKDYKAARDYWQLSVKQDYPTSYNSLAVYYDVCERRPDIYIPLYRTAIEKGYAGAWSNLGMYYQNVEKDNATAIQYYRRAAELGNAHGMICLGYSLYEKDKMEALRWYQRAASTGTANSLHQMGGWYEDEREIDNAIDYYMKAAAKNWGKSCYRLAYVYAKYKEDEVKAEEWYRKGAELDDLWCLFELAKKKIAAVEVEDNVLPVHIPEKFLARVILQGDSEHLAAVGEWFYRRWIIYEPELELMGYAEMELAYEYKRKILQYWLRSAAAGNDDGDLFYAIGFYYDVMSHNWPSAKPWYLRASEGKHGQALHRLGQCSLSIENDREAALNYFRLGAEAGNLDSKESYEELLGNQQQNNHSLNLPHPTPSQDDEDQTLPPVPAVAPLQTTTDQTVVNAERIYNQELHQLLGMLNIVDDSDSDSGDDDDDDEVEDVEVVEEVEAVAVQAVEEDGGGGDREDI